MELFAVIIGSVLFLIALGFVIRWAVKSAVSNALEEYTVTLSAALLAARRDEHYVPQTLRKP